jgi:deazaflavin-dependent oxidoreductase (nitroreductase family)
VASVSLELLREPVTSRHAVALFEVVMRETRTGAVECDTVADRSSPSHPATLVRVQFMSQHLASPKLDLRNRAAGRFLRLANPIARRLIPAGLPTGAPNVLLAMRGRRSGRIRSVPLGILELGGRSFVQASYGETGWVANLRANGEATVTHPGGRGAPVQAIELEPEEAGAVLQRALQRFPRSRVVGALLGPRFRPPIGVLLTLRIRIDDTLDEYTEEARRHPLFELRPRDQADAGGRRFA